MSDTIPKSQRSPVFHHEFRLGLVVYGGISLAIYMNGVCREFYNAVRGRGLYKLLKALTDSDIIVDVVSGTSAGGINGVLLSYALTNSTASDVFDFKNFADVWRESGNINRLLRNTSAFASSNSDRVVDSVLDGETYYQGELVNAFEKVWKNQSPAPLGEWYSPSSELDLFVTGTDLLGKVYKAFDNTGRLIEVKDHRTVFLLKHREGRKQPFQPDKTQIAQQALAKLCRLTSCFPVAFPVVSVKLPKSSGSNDVNSADRDFEIDDRLVEWGQLDNRELPPESETVDGRQLHFVDGGVLDNRPFSYTINEIYNRTAYRPVDRKLFYIDPSPDQFLGSLKFRRMEKPSIWQVALDSLVAMPRYESIANDLQLIHDRNEKVRRYKHLRGTAERSAEEAAKADRQSMPTPPSTPEGSSDSLKSPSPEQIYLRCRLVGLRDRILPLILRIDQVANPNNQNKQALLEKAAKLLTQYVSDDSEQAKREKFLHRLGEQIRNLDVDYALRKHFFLLEKTCEEMGETVHLQERNLLEELAKKLCRQVELLEVIRAALEYMLKLQTVSNGFGALIEQTQQRDLMSKQAYEYLLRLHRFLLDKDGLSDFQPHRNRQDLEPLSAHFFDQLHPPYSTRQLSSLFAQLRQKADDLKQANKLSLNSSDSIWQNARYHYLPDSENDSDRYFSILRKVEQASEVLIESSGLKNWQPLLDTFRSFRKIDQAVYAYEFLAGIPSKEQIEIFRISPDDAQKGLGRSKGVADKLAGDQLYAFGGFFKKSWRSNDILWGRLDGVNRIVDALLTAESLQNLPGFLNRQTAHLEGEPAEKNQRYLTALLAETLPSATVAEISEILRLLMQIQSATIADADVEALQELLVRAEHRAIVRSELGNVLEDSIAEQITWNQQQVQPQKDYKKALQTLSYQPVLIPANVPEDQRIALAQLNYLIKTVIDPKLLSGIAGSLSERAQRHQPKVGIGLASVAGQSSGKNARKEERYLQYVMQTAFPNADPADRQSLIQYPLALAQAPIASVDDLSEFLIRLLKVGRAELRNAQGNGEIMQAIEAMNAQLQQMLVKLKPKYSPVTGYFDRTVTPLAAKELARSSTQRLFDQHQEEDYFRNVYQVGSEKLTDGIPKLILQNLAARAGLILRDILVSPPTGARVRPTLVYRFGNALLQLFYWSVRARSPKAFQFGQPSLVRSLLELLFVIAVVALTVVVITKLPYWLLVAMLAAIVLGLIYVVRSRFLS